MLVEVKVPQLAEGTPEGTLVSWNKAEGAVVARDENLVDIETDKVVLETPAPAAGILVSIKIPNGSTVKSDMVLAVIDTEGKAASPSASASSPTAARSDHKVAASGASVAPAAPANTEAMPAARKMMAEAGLSAADVSGTGRDGRILKEDVLNQQAQQANIAPVTPSAPSLGSSSARLEERVPMSRLRQKVAERLVQSQSTAAILTTFNEVNMQPVIDLRKRYGERFEKEHGVKLGFMSFFVKAAVHALKKFPVVNASIDGNDIIYHGYFDIGVAVGSPRGLVVPILRDVEALSMAEIEKQIANFGKRAQDGKLTVEELTGGTFTISNGGVFGSMLSTPIINPPQSAILGIHATKERPVVENGQVVIRPINYLALSYDHRLIDGREAVLTLVAIKEALEDPARLVLGL